MSSKVNSIRSRPGAWSEALASLFTSRGDHYSHILPVVTRTSVLLSHDAPRLILWKASSLSAEMQMNPSTA